MVKPLLFSGLLCLSSAGKAKGLALRSNPDFVRPKLPSIKLGAHRRFRKQDIQKFLDKLGPHQAA